MSLALAAAHSGSSTRDSVVELREVFCVHRTREGDAAALQGTSLRVARGELLCVLGPSGAGKSTLLRVIAGLQVPSAGVVNVLGTDMGRLSRRWRARLRHASIGFLGQHAQAALAPDLAIAESVGLPLALRGTPRRMRVTQIERLLDQAGLSSRHRARPAELSGGERQRAALCAALVAEPELLLADEPTGELDGQSAADLRAMIAGMARSRGTTVILVSHDPAAATFADRVVRLRDGRIIEERGPGGDGLVVGSGGWLHLSPELLRAAGIREWARAHPAPGGLLITPVEEVASPSAVTGPAPRSREVMASWTAAHAELRAVSRRRGRGAARRLVIDAVTHAFTAGRMTVVTGRSGSGKTTLLRLLAALDLPDAGNVLVDASPTDLRDPEGLARLRRDRIGYLPQEPSPVAFLSAEENVVLTLRLRGWSPEAAAVRAAVVLTQLGLADRARQRVERLSAGETQRVALARALAGARGLLVADEPTSRLDEANADAAARLLASAAGEDRQTVICATHDPALIAHAHEVLELGG